MKKTGIITFVFILLSGTFFVSYYIYGASWIPHKNQDTNPVASKSSITVTNSSVATTTTTTSATTTKIISPKKSAASKVPVKKTAGLTASVISSKPVINSASAPIKIPETPPPAPPAPPLTAQFIYIDNNFAAGWTTETPQESNVLTMNFQKPWDEIYLQNKSGIDVSGYEGLTLTIAGEKGGEKINIVFYGADGSRIGSANIADFMPGYKLSTKFTDGYIPFRSINLKSHVISKILFTSEKPAKVFISNMLFSGEPTSIPSGGYYVGAGEVFDGNTENAWYLGSWNAQTEIISSGDSANSSTLQANFTKAGGGIYFKNSLGMNTYSYHHLLFSIKGEALSQKISVALYGPNNSFLGSVWINDFIQSSEYTNYQTVSIPLVDLGAENTVVENITFSSSAPTPNFYIGNLQFKF